MCYYGTDVWMILVIYNPNIKNEHLIILNKLRNNNATILESDKTYTPVIMFIDEKKNY